MMELDHDLDMVLRAFWELVHRSLGLAHESIREAARRAEELIRKRAPRRSGKLAQSVGSTVEGDRALVGVGVDYAPFLEWGTRPHEIRPRRARALRFYAGGRLVFARRVLHPGIRPRLFVLSAAEALREELSGLVEGIWHDISGQIHG